MQLALFIIQIVVLLARLIVPLLPKGPRAGLQGWIDSRRR